MSSQISMLSSHSAQARSETTAALRARVGQRPGLEGSTQPVLVRISEAALRDAIKPAAVGVAEATHEQGDAAGLDDRLAVLRQFVEYITGVRMQVFDPSELSGGQRTASSHPPPSAATTPALQAAGFGVEVEVTESYIELEQTQFAAAGSIRTADGKTLQFQLTLLESRRFERHSALALRGGEAVRKDPLVLNFSGTAAQLTDSRFRFDIDADGSLEDLPMLAQGNGFLALDVNANGRIDSGAELFGARSGDGFTELAQFDSDGNHVIDENDPIFARLQIWSPEPGDGPGALSSLAEREVGALLLDHAATPFTLRAATGELGAVRSTGLYLTQAGTPGVMQQIDVVV